MNWKVGRVPRAALLELLFVSLKTCLCIGESNCPDYFLYQKLCRWNELVVGTVGKEHMDKHSQQMKNSVMADVGRNQEGRTR